MQYDELIAQCIKALKGFNPKIEGPNSFIEKFLKSVNYKKIFNYNLTIGNKRNCRKNVHKTSILWSSKIHRFFENFY